MVKVHACSLNASDNEFLRGSPVYTRMWGMFRPKYTVLGSDIAGVVELAGSEVSRFKKGDAVFGDIFNVWGGFAEYVCAPEDKLFIKPDYLSFREASAVPQSGLVAYQGLTGKGGIGEGSRVLINGAGGGAGSFAIQIAKSFGAEVTAVDSTEKLDLMKNIGADHVIDYTQKDFTRAGVQFDRILDLVYSHSVMGYRRSLKPGGRYLMVGGTVPDVLAILTLGQLVSRIGKRKIGILGHVPNRDMENLLELIREGSVKPVIDRCFPLEKTAEAFRYLEDGHTKGKVVITLSEDSKS